MLSPEYQKQLTDLHAQQKWGSGGWRALPKLLSLIIEYGVKDPTVLDFGAGERTLEKTAQWALPHVQVTSYDPGVPGIATLPNGIWDFTVCTDVLEHIEPEFVDAVLDRIRASTQYAAYFIIACTPTKTILPDGRNAHLTVQPIDWWREKLEKRWAGEMDFGRHKNFEVIVRA